MFHNIVSIYDIDFNASFKSLQNFLFEYQNLILVFDSNIIHNSVIQILFIIFPY